jgi:hypothetical protein
LVHKTWASGRNIRDASATPSGVKREWYVCMYVSIASLSVKHLLYLVEGLALRLGQQRDREDEPDAAADRQDPERGVYAVRRRYVTEKSREQKKYRNHLCM